MAEVKTLTSKDVAEQIGTDAKSLRVFLRTPQGKALVTKEGKSYVFKPADVAKVRKGFEAYEAARKVRVEANPTPTASSDEAEG